MPCRIYKLDFQEKNLKIFKCLHDKNEGVWYLSFQEEHLSIDWSRNLDSSMVKSAWLVI